MNYYDQMIDLIQPVDLTVARQAFPDYDEALLKELLKQLDHSGAVSKTEVWNRLDYFCNEIDFTGVYCSNNYSSTINFDQCFLTIVSVYWCWSTQLLCV